MAYDEQQNPDPILSLQERMGPQLEQMKDNLEQLNQKAIRLMREQPGLCLLGAVAAGYVIGRLVSRR